MTRKSNTAMTDPTPAPRGAMPPAAVQGASAVRAIDRLGVVIGIAAVLTFAAAAAGALGAAYGVSLPIGGGWVPVMLAGATLVALGILWFGLSRLRRMTERQHQAVEAQRLESDRNQQAILRLLDELSSLADGDLTVQATVTEDITGAIADSINYAVEALRGLVTTINGSAIQLDGATRQTQALSQHLAKASGAQSKQIASATESAASMAGSVEEVSGNAE